MRKIFYFLFVFFISNSFANNLSFDSGVLCNTENLHTQNDTTFLLKVFEPIKTNCTNGTFLPANSNSCANCPTGYVCNGGTFSFNPYNAQGLDTTQMFATSVNNMCAKNVLNSIDNKTVLVPVFRVIKYTCESGYFLPANSSSCVQCPTGYTCPGGTYPANSNIVQGINITETFNGAVANVCSSNFLRAPNNATNIVALYEPNTININWDNGDTTTTTTCEYNGTITLPPEPSPRPGYTFSGWRLKEN